MSSRTPPPISPGTSRGVETVRGQDIERSGAGEDPSVAARTTRSGSAVFRSRVVDPVPDAVVSHKSELVGSALDASRTVQPFASVLGATVGSTDPPGAGDVVGSASSPHLVVTSEASSVSQSVRPVTDT